LRPKSANNKSQLRIFAVALFDNHRYSATLKEGHIQFRQEYGMFQEKEEGGAVFHIFKSSAYYAQGRGFFAQGRGHAKDHKL